MQYIQRELSVVCVGPTYQALGKQPRRSQDYYSTLPVPEECIAPRRPRERRGAIDANTSHALRAPPAAGERMIRQEAVLSRIHDPGTTRDRLVWLLAVYTVGGIRVVHVYAKVPPQLCAPERTGRMPRHEEQRSATLHPRDNGVAFFVSEGGVRPVGCRDARIAPVDEGILKRLWRCEDKDVVS